MSDNRHSVKQHRSVEKDPRTEDPLAFRLAHNDNDRLRAVLETAAKRFDSGKILNGRFSQYPVPRFSDVPELDIHLLDRPDLDSAGGGETPIIAIAPAIANAVFDATGVRVRSLPIRDAAPRKT